MNGTRPEQVPDTKSDTALTSAPEKPNEHSGEAGWRRGYAADCKSVKTGSIPVPASKDFNVIACCTLIVVSPRVSSFCSGLVPFRFVLPLPVVPA